jgi:hypothetical protein
MRYNGRKKEQVANTNTKRYKKPHIIIKQLKAFIQTITIRKNEENKKCHQIIHAQNVEAHG